MQTKPELTIIIPALNEEAVIETSLGRLARYLKDSGLLAVTEVIVVAATTTDRTRERAQVHRGDFTWFQLLTPADQVGKGRDVALGVAAAHGQFILFTDADLATPLHHIEDAVAKLKQGADVVIGVRNLWQIHTGWLRKIASVTANWLVRLLLLPGMPDSQCGFKGFRAAAARELFTQLTILGWGFDIELLVVATKRRLHVVHLPIPDWCDPRPGGGLVGESTGRASLRTLRELLKIRAARAAGVYD